jgi:branched-chain amino acid aminotransferase
VNAELSPARGGAFETLRVYRGTPFAWRRHIERLAAAARALGIAAPESARLRRAVDDVLRADRLVDARVRITLIAGPDATPDVIIASGALPPRQPRARIVTAPWPRNDRAATAGVKSTSYAENVRAFADARSVGADECIFANTRGELCEATGSNVFVVERGALRTPPASSGCLLGVTRALVIELARSVGIPVEEVALRLGALASADEAFLTSTTREVQPIGTIDGRSRGPAPGPVTLRLARLFSELVDHDPDP